ncbi:winged helix DNA-binding protein [Haloarchaeobius amylolyticus]|uniref:winged helix DNA-binding protein n=1 Tax=Haloarchaeobius amylolyticus TaxID=1198296 RepID=UPI0022702F35|nr:winged helix DNA-binding protein [Haloarchaeobius amylolyticus]
MTFDAVVEVTGKKRTLEVLWTVNQSSDPVRFSAIDEAVATSSDITTDRLRLLVEYGLLSRREKNKRNVTYEVTTRGESVLDYLLEVESLLERGRVQN